MRKSSSTRRLEVMNAAQDQNQIWTYSWVTPSSHLYPFLHLDEERQSGVKFLDKVSNTTGEAWTSDLQICSGVRGVNHLPEIYCLLIPYGVKTTKAVFWRVKLTSAYSGLNSSVIGYIGPSQMHISPSFWNCHVNPSICFINSEKIIDAC